MLFKSLFTLLFGAVGARAAAGSLEQVTDFGPNPTGVEMYVYKPEKLAHRPPLIVGIHWCHGTADAFYEGTQFANLSDTHGFVVIYPNASATLDYTPGNEGCWDVYTNATLKHNGGGDSLGIASMVRHAIKHYGVDTEKIFVTGVSSGAMMTNVMCGAYPELFKACSASSGVPFGCFAGPDVWNTECANGENIKTPREWVCRFRDVLYIPSLIQSAIRGILREVLIQAIEGPAQSFNFGMELSKTVLRVSSIVVL